MEIKEETKSAIKEEGSKSEFKEIEDENTFSPG